MLPMGHSLSNGFHEGPRAHGDAFGPLWLPSHGILSNGGGDQMLVVRPKFRKASSSEEAQTGLLVDWHKSRYSKVYEFLTNKKQTWKRAAKNR
jgi:hypothetical protein